MRCRKLNPRAMAKNPVMFVVEVGSASSPRCCLYCRITPATSASTCRSRVAVVHGAVRQLRRGDGGGSRQGAGRCAAQGEVRDHGIQAERRTAQMEEVPSSQLRVGDMVRVVAGQMVPGDGEVTEGVASVDESAITGEICAGNPRGGRRSFGSDRRHARAERRDRRAHHGEPRRDVSRPHDRAGGRRGAAEDAERDCAEYSARWADDHLSACGGYAAAVRHLLRRAADGVCADLAAGVPDPDDDRRAALGHRNRGHGSPGAAQRACRQRPCGRSGGRCEYAAAG